MPDSSSSTKKDNGYSTGELVRRLAGLAWRFRADCLQCLLLSLALLLLGLCGLQLLGTVVDVIRHALDPSQKAPAYPWGWTPPINWPPLKVVTALALAIIAQALLRALLTYQYNMVTARLTQGKIVPLLRDRLYATMQNLSFRFFDRQGTSSLFNRVTGDVQNTRLFVDGVVLQGLNMVLTLVAYFIFMWTIHPGLTIACLSSSIGLWWITRYYSNRLRPAYIRNRELFDELVLLFTEHVRGMQTVKGFAAEPEQQQRFEEANSRVSSQQRRIFLDLSLFTPATQFVSQFSLVVLFGYGGWLYVHNQVPLGTGLVVFAGLLQQFNGQVANITTIANSVQQSFTAARRVFEVLDTHSEIQNRQGAIIPTQLKGKIEFQQVIYGYSHETPVLQEISFAAQPGQVIGIFGVTGSGKSTLLSLIPRFYDPQQGRILVDETDLRELDVDEYRRRVGIVYQESFLFSNTVAANIAFGSPHATQEQIERAARMASAHDFILDLPHAYETVLGEAGADLSGGQRQRLALARALLLEPRILLLDDPTASVDPKTEHEIATALKQATTGRTTFLVSNRLSLLRRADRILVLAGGRNIGFGTHKELVHTPGPYRDTALLQLMDLDENIIAPAVPQDSAAAAEAEVRTS